MTTSGIIDVFRQRQRVTHLAQTEQAGVGRGAAIVNTEWIGDILDDLRQRGLLRRLPELHHDPEDGHRGAAEVGASRGLGGGRDLGGRARSPRLAFLGCGLLALEAAPELHPPAMTLDLVLARGRRQFDLFTPPVAEGGVPRLAAAGRECHNTAHMGQSLQG